MEEQMSKIQKTLEYFWSMFFSVWLFLDGKKTSIGAACLALAAYLEGLRYVLENSGDTWGTCIGVLTLNGTLLTGTGGIHKYVKAKTAADPTPEVINPS